MSLVYVQYKEVCVDRYRGTGPYPDWSRTNEFSIDGVTLDKSHRWNYDAIQIAPAVVEGDEVWVLWLTYREGDSFGTETGKGEIMWVFTEAAVANKALEKLQALNVSHVAVFDFDDEDGETIYLSNPANDYFSRVEHFYLTSHTVGQCPDPSY